MLLPTECLEQLKCFLCKRLLSRFPIYMIEDEDNQLLSVCGRCEVPSGKKYWRNTIYENGMKNVEFPCINREKGCMEYLFPEHIEQHELLCQCQPMKCKICEWEGQPSTLIDHYKSEHDDLILKNHQFKMNIKEDSNCSNILLDMDAIFSFERNFDQNLKRLKCTLTTLFATKNIKKFCAFINLLIDDTTVAKMFPQIDINANEPKSIDINIGGLLNDDSTEAAGVITITSDINASNLNYVGKTGEENLPKCKWYPVLYYALDRSLPKL